MRTVLLGLVLGTSVTAYACESGGDGASGGNFTAPDSGFGSSGSSGSSGSMTDEAGAGEGGPQGDAAVDESTAPVALINMTTGTMSGAASSDGSAIVISIVGDAASAINFSLYEPATGWTTGAPIPSVTTTSTILGSAVAIDGKGNAFVVWTTNVVDDARTHFYVARFDHATRMWSAAQQPDTYAESFSNWVAIAANAGGDAIATALHNGATLDHNVVGVHYDSASGTWGTETVQAIDNAGYAETPEIHLTDNGKALVTAYPRTMAMRSSAGVWSQSPDVSASFIGISGAINEAGDILLAGETSSNYAQAYRYDAATSMWVPPVMISSTFTFTHGGFCHATMGIRPNGDGVLVRCFDADPKPVMESYSFTKATNTWSAATILDETNSPTRVTWAFDAAGDGFVLYQDVPTNPAPTPAVMNSYEGGVWSKQSAALGGNINTDYTPAGFLSPNGRGFAVWGEGAQLHAKKVR